LPLPISLGKILAGMLLSALWAGKQECNQKYWSLSVLAESLDSWFFLSFFPAELLQLVAGREKAKNLAGEMSSA
jgi:hypothetical protein